MGGQMSCSSPHPPSDAASDRAAQSQSHSQSQSQSQAYHKHKQKDGNAHLISQRLIKLASKNSSSMASTQAQAAALHHDKGASSGAASSQSQAASHQQPQPSSDRHASGAGAGSGSTGSRAIPLSHPALSHSSAQQAFQSHTQPTVRPQSAQAPSQPEPPQNTQLAHPLRSSNSYQTLGPMVYVCCATSRIGIATIRGLRMNYPSIKIRAGVGMYENKSEVIRMFRDAHLDDIDCVQVDPRKRQSLIWALVGVQALLVIPDAETNVRTALAHVQAAKTAGVALVTVVTKPKPADKASTSTNNSTDPKKAVTTESTPHVVERYTLKTKLGCCFMRLPLDLVDDIVCPAPPAGSVTMSSPSDGVLAGAPKFHLSDVGTACATILANHQQHVFTRYDLEVADADNKRKYQESLEHQQQQQQQQQQQLRHGSVSGAGSPTQVGSDDHDSSQPSTPDSCNRGTKSRRGSTASTITDVSDRSNSSTPEHSRNHCRHMNPSHHHHHHYEQHHRSRSNSSDEHSPQHHSPGRVH